MQPYVNEALKKILVSFAKAGPQEEPEPILNQLIGCDGTRPLRGLRNHTSALCYCISAFQCLISVPVSRDGMNDCA